MIPLLSFLVLVAYEVVAGPVSSTRSNGPTHNNSSLSLQFTQYNVPSRTVSIDLPPSAVPVNVTDASSSSSQFTTVLSLNSPSLSPSLIPFASHPTADVFVTEVATAFETVTILPTTSTSIVAVVVTATATTTVAATSSASQDAGIRWISPHQITDVVSAFNVTYFPSGKQNLHVVAQVPAEYFAPVTKTHLSELTTTSRLNGTTTVPASAILQLVYPAHSVNPGSKPVGGADFYASPLDLTGARNVTLEYSVLFPADFDWVKGGKLPGLFGGHTGCSGGSSARDCFSTRLMWRSRGAGELYLYAPKDKQTMDLCEAVGSVCDASYGFSLGRGAFNFTPGDWTHLRQNVVLNTPGHNDGTFTLFVDGQQKVYRTDMFYRDVVRQSKKSQPVEFVGLFFSTFFGGHGKQYATPKQQYTWFKDFAITCHDR